jgi:hypothetical protein
LLDRVRWFVDERGELPEDALGEYDELDVAPTAVYRSKQAHEDAVVTLTESLAAAVSDDPAVAERADDAGETSEESAVTDDRAPSARSD